MKSSLLRLLTTILILAAAHSGSSAQCGVQIGAGNISPVYYVAGCQGSMNLEIRTWGATSYAHQWQYKATAAGSYADITGATGTSYLPMVSGYYRLHVSSAFCSGYTDSVNVVVSTSVPAAITSPSFHLCPGGAPARLSVPGMHGQYGYEWYAGSTLLTHDSFYLASMPGTYHCVVTDLTTSCTGTAPTVTLTSGFPLPPAVVSPVSHCQNTVATALVATGSGLKWYTTPTGGLAAYTPPTPSTATVGRDTFYVSESIGACEGPRSRVVVEILPLPAAPAATTLYRYCHNTPASTLTAAGSNLHWYTSALGGTPGSTAPTPSTATPGNDTFYVSQTGGSCESQRLPIVVRTLALPAAPVPTVINVTVCPGDSLWLMASGAHGFIQWTGPRAFSDTGANVGRRNISDADTGYYLVRVTDTFGCVSFYDSVRLRINCPDSVWAGDVNLDKVVDHFDALSLALAMGSTGPARTGATILWQPQLCASWNQSVPGLGSVNRKHADCDGNGTVGFSDTLAIAANYGLNHPRRNRVPAPRTTGVPVLHFDLTGLRAIEGRTIRIPVMFGSGASLVTTIAGIAGTLEIEGIVPSSVPQLSYTGSWLNGPAMMRFDRSRSNNSLDWVYARTDQSQTPGGGLFATLELEIPDGTAGSMMKLYLDDVLVKEATGSTFPDYQVLGDSILIESAVGVNALHAETTGFSLSPNPSSGNCAATVRLATAGAFHIDILDLSGRLIRSVSGNSNGRREARMALPVADLGAGVYMIQLRDASGTASQPQRWIRL